MNKTTQGEGKQIVKNALTNVAMGNYLQIHMKEADSCTKLCVPNLGHA